ncbi:geranylgeranyl transferase type-2 subunit beta [Podospora australis]|uniref:Geranylgeranyl transferase type-2 subunit beta n=1 Tax=Podospora australis TaxID=1536484 RepID=A0AAN6X1Q4_9PEZI|nr:geranylgeranyl transferase type-2 subunit beta [Podospora australis]
MNQPTLPPFDIERQLKYWKMCLDRPLPHHYLSNEANRMALAWFIINSITILTPDLDESVGARTESSRSDSSVVARTESPTSDSSVVAQTESSTTSKQLISPISPEDKPKLRQWVLSHQQPGGGFASTSSLVFPLHAHEQWAAETGTETTERSGMANAPGTLFALQLLALLADDDDPAGAFNGVDRVQTLRWLKRLQREDGSFGEVLRQLPGQGWFIGGGYDMRYCYIAAAIRWMLRDEELPADQPGYVEDIDTKRLMMYISMCQSYSGGFAGSSRDEAHAGYAYCALAAIRLLDRPLETLPGYYHSELIYKIIPDMSRLNRWLAWRQFVYLDPNTPSVELDPSSSASVEDGDIVNFLLPKSPADLSLLTAEDKSASLLVASNGRTNKVADTCYTWWVGAALANANQSAFLHKNPLFDWRASRRFLLEKMAHPIGGFSKYPGGPPDVYHSCFGLAALGLMLEPGLEHVDPDFAVPLNTVKVIEKARAKLFEQPKRASALALDLQKMGVEMGGSSTPKWMQTLYGFT